MRILILTKRYYTNKDFIRDRFGRLYHLPLQLKMNGNEVLIIVADYKGTKIECHQMSGISAISYPLRSIRIFEYWASCLQQIRKFGPHVILASGDTHFGMLGVLLSKQLKVPIVFDLYDDYTTFGTNRFPLMKALFNWTVRRADRIVCASRPLKDKLHRMNRKIEIVENGVDTKLFKPIPKNLARSKLGIRHEDIIIGYFGYIGQSHGTEVLSKAVSRLKRFYPHLQLLLAGKKATDISLKEPHIDYRGTISQDEVPLFINASDVVVIPYLPSPQIDVSSPCKLPEYLACGVPVASTRVTDMPYFLSKTPEALCNPGNINDMVRALKWQLDNRKTVALPEYLRWESLGIKMTKIFEEVLAK